MIDSFVKGMPVTDSPFGNGAYSANFASLSQSDWTDEGHVSLTRAMDGSIWRHACTGDGDKGDGNGPGVQGNASKGPAAFPKGMTQTLLIATFRGDVDLRSEGGVSFFLGSRGGLDNNPEEFGDLSGRARSRARRISVASSQVQVKPSSV